MKKINIKRKRGKLAQISFDIYRTEKSEYAYACYNYSRRKEILVCIKQIMRKAFHSYNKSYSKHKERNN